MDTSRIPLYDGLTGRIAGTVVSVAVPAKGIVQSNATLSQSAPGVAGGYAAVTRKPGYDPFIAYADVDDGRQPGERCRDGAFVEGNSPRASRIAAGVSPGLVADPPQRRKE